MKWMTLLLTLSLFGIACTDDETMNESVEQPDGDEDGELPVSLSTRAKPLIDLLESGIEKGGYVMWKEQ